MLRSQRGITVVELVIIALILSLSSLIIFGLWEKHSDNVVARTLPDLGKSVVLATLDDTKNLIVLYPDAGFVCIGSRGNSNVLVSTESLGCSAESTVSSQIQVLISNYRDRKFVDTQSNCDVGLSC